MDLTSGPIYKNLIKFAAPYFLACFLQTFYGLADLFIIGQFKLAPTINAVAMGSQIMHLIILVIAGMTMGITVNLGKAVGNKDSGKQVNIIGNSITLFAISAVLMGGIFILSLPFLVRLLQTPGESVAETNIYTLICFSGIPVITAYNVLSAIFRGFGDSKHPMICIAIGGIINLLLDYLLIGPLDMGAAGAAWATLAGQVISVVCAAAFMKKVLEKAGLTKIKPLCNMADFKLILDVGLPNAAQEFVIQVAFMFITAIANSRGVEMAASVGIVEKLICFFFLVPSAMLAAVSAICAQNRGACRHDRSKATLKYGVMTVFAYGLAIGIVCLFFAPGIIALFDKEAMVIAYGAEYLRPYSIDTCLAGIHFCFSGFFCAYGRANWTFYHNLVSCACIRVPGTWLMAELFPRTLLPMGIVAPAGSVVSIIICLSVYWYFWGRKLSPEIAAN